MQNTRERPDETVKLWSRCPLVVFFVNAQQPVVPLRDRRAVVMSWLLLGHGNQGRQTQKENSITCVFQRGGVDRGETQQFIDKRNHIKNIK